MRYSILASLLVVFVFAANGSSGAADEADRYRQIYQEAVIDPTNQAKVDAFVATLIEVPPGSKRYLVEGDILLSRDEIESYLKALNRPLGGHLKSGELIVNMAGDRMDYLVEPSRRRMLYSVDMQSFPDAESAELVRTNVRKAADDWEGICPDCGIQFKETDRGGGATAQQQRPYFVVRYQKIQGAAIARAFFPNSPPDDRILNVFPVYFQSSMNFDRVGVFRHELGHILGYRHEHIGNIPGCATEGASWKTITPYTPKSVMHYFCGGEGSLSLRIVEEDARGHRCLYLKGQPCPN